MTNVNTEKILIYKTIVFLQTYYAVNVFLNCILTIIHS